jgi:aminoglycoside phosphotransferase (APT) family kinase protein
VAWATAAFGPGAEVVSVAPLAGGGWHENLAVDVRDARGRAQELVLRLWSRPEWKAEDPHLTPEREAAVLAFLEREGFAREFPRVVATDPAGDACGVPALLLTRLAGAPPAAPSPAARTTDAPSPAARTTDAPSPTAAAREYAAALEAVHALPPAFEPWRAYYALDRIAPPPGRLWERALEVAAAPAPDLPVSFIHRDFNPGNTLWRDGRLTGVIDWTQGCTGPAAADAGHLRWNLALAHGLDVARAVAGDAHPWWDVRTLLDVLPELDAPAVARLEPYLAAALAELGR